MSARLAASAMTVCFLSVKEQLVAFAFAGAISLRFAA
jgi:hypothetical protein